MRLHPVVLDPAPSRPAVRAAAEAYLVELASLPDAEIGGWIVYVLEGLREWVIDDVYDVTLAEVRNAITERLNGNFGAPGDA